jgi:hypothetical protein
MLIPPTDRLHKFLAIAGLALFSLGVTVPLQKYQDAELQLIEARAKLRETQNAYNRYAAQVNAMIAIYGEAAEKGGGPETTSAAREKILKLDPDATKLGREVEDVLIQVVKQIELASHLENIKTIWFAIGLLFLFGGTAIAFVGFKQWLLQPKNAR